MVKAQVETRLHPVLEAAEKTGIQVKILPWWGSVRQRNEQIHKGCGREVRDTNWGKYCGRCGQIKDSEVVIEKKPHKWLCPGGYGGNSIKWPEVRGETVCMWEGPCDAGVRKEHKHRQELTVIDINETAFLLRIKCSLSYMHFIIGMDDEHPFVTPVLRRLNTIQDAFDWLVPNKVREALTLGEDVKRQGDWFFIPTDKPPRLDGCYGTRHFGIKTFKLYENHRLIYGSQTRHIGQQVIYKSVLGLPYPAPFVKGDVRAPDHPTLHLENWHIGVRTRSTPAGGSDGPGLD